jgi:hypothetical protein
MEQGAEEATAKGREGAPWEAPSRGKKGLGPWLGARRPWKVLAAVKRGKKGRPALARWEEGEDAMGGEGAPCTLPEKRGTLLQPWGGEGCACGRGGRREWRLGGRCNFPNWQGEALLFI